MTIKEASEGVLPKEFVKDYVLADPTVVGILDSSNAEEFKSGLQADIEALKQKGKHPKIVLDMAQITELKAGSLRAIKDIDMELRKNHGDLVLANASPEILANLNIIAFDKTTKLGTPKSS